MVDRWRRAGRAVCLQSLAAGCLAALASLLAASASAEPNVGGVRLGSFADPVHVAAAPDHPRLLFVVERAGRIMLMRDEKKLSQPFLDIKTIVRGRPDSGSGGEEGLLSVAFPPDYQTSGRFYVFFTNRQGNVELDEFRRAAGTGLRADPASRRVVLVIPHPGATNHNGGQLDFGVKGMLYVSVGDGGGGGEMRGENARKLNSLLGKILRIDPRRSGSRPYAVPPDNPFVGKPGRDEIFAYGLRNPWRVSFDGRNLAISDVGQNLREEVNLLPWGAARGANFGWPQYEGKLIFDASRPGPHPPKFPIFNYAHAAGRCAIIGGYVVRGPQLPGLDGRYLYGDACTGELRSFRPNVAHQTASADASAGLVLRGLTSFGRGLDGTLYAAQAGTPGAVYRLVPAP